MKVGYAYKHDIVKFVFIFVDMSIVEVLGGRGVKPIAAAFIQADVSRCHKLVGWFDQLDPQWKVTQCVWDKVNCIALYNCISRCFNLLLVHRSSSDY